MYASNFRQRGFLFRTAALWALDMSRKLAALSPRLERAVFKGPLKLRQMLGRV
jgi:hypothetical protein